MSKILNSVSDIFVKKIWDKLWEILTKKEIIDLWIRSGGSQSRVTYAMSILLGRNLIVKIANWVYMIKKNQDVDIWLMYWSVIEKLIDTYSPSWWVIWWEKAIEFHLQNFSIPDILIIYTRDTAIRVRIIDGREVHFRTLVSWAKTNKKNLWRIIIDNATWIEIPQKMQICGKELALLEALSLRRHDIGIEEANIVRFLRSYHSTISRSILGMLAKYRYIRPINRLRIIARDLWYQELYNKTLEVIRDEWGGCYLNI